MYKEKPRITLLILLQQTGLSTFIRYNFDADHLSDFVYFFRKLFSQVKYSEKGRTIEEGHSCFLLIILMNVKRYDCVIIMNITLEVSSTLQVLNKLPVVLHCSPLKAHSLQHRFHWY